jgi:uncharacterized protein
MRHGWPGLLGLFWLALQPPLVVAADTVPVPRLEARVTDRTGTLDATNKQRLETLLEAIERDRGAQIAVLLVPTTQPETLEQFGIRLAEAWKIGHKGADNGVIIIVAKNDRKMRIEVGYGLEGSIPDAIAKRIVAERMAPRFKQGDFAGGLIDAVEALEQAMGGPAAAAAPVASPAMPAAAGDGGGAHDYNDGENPEWMPWLFGSLIAAGVLRMVFGLTGSFVAAAVGGWLGFMVFGSLAFAIGAAVLVFVLSFVNMFTGGGGGSTGGGFSSGGGGFSGGGGSFGGGGASGDW